MYGCNITDLDMEFMSLPLFSNRFIALTRLLLLSLLLLLYFCTVVLRRLGHGDALQLSSGLLQRPVRSRNSYQLVLHLAKTPGFSHSNYTVQ